jgi:K+-sensing histidine kinase KdpD
MRDHVSVRIEEVFNAAYNIVCTPSPAAACRKIVEELCQLTAAKHGTLFVRRQNKFYRAYSTVPIKHWMNPSPRGYTYHAYKTHSLTILTEDALKKSHPEQARQGIGTLILVPLAIGSKSVGVVSLHYDNKKQFGQTEIELLKKLSRFAANSLDDKLQYMVAQKKLKHNELSTALTAHELKTPLTTINTYAQLISRQIEQGKDITWKWFSLLIDETKRASNLLSEYLEDKNTDNKDVVSDLHDVLERAILSFSVNYPAHSLDVANSIKGRAFVRGESEKLLQVLTNILNNAGKFSVADESIHIRVFKKAKHSVVVVTDKGPGIKKEDITQVFKQWYKGDKRKEGKGLGLFLSKKIMNDCGGDIEITSEYKKGTSVHISFYTA